jgi:hypothetical protein
VTVSESKERAKGSNDSESSSETGTEVGTEAGMAFSFIGISFFCKKSGELSFLWEGGITVFQGTTGADRLCDEGPGQDDEGRGGNAAPRMK